MKPTLCVFCLTLLLISSAYAQQAPPITLGEPIATSYNYWGTEQFAWLDNETLVVEVPPDSENPIPTAFSYHAPTGESTFLEVSPLYFNATQEEIEHYQMLLHPEDGYPAYQSPFQNELRVPDVIYASTLQIACGNECVGSLIMAGQRPNDENERGIYQPLDFSLQCGMSVVWARGADAAIVRIGSCFGCCGALHHVALRDDYPDTLIGYIDSPDADLYAISADGNRVLYSQWAGMPSLQLVLWEMETLSVDAFTGVRTETTIIEPQTDEYYSFAGANFVEDDPTQIIVVHHDSLMRIDLETDERTIINPDLNAAWIDLAFLSPDNRYIALIDDGAVYVVETGID